ncbi:MAG TPA: hypothetical protein VGK10_19430 [Prolixibacteraceae bacterium]|jgi:hypothetical protein
MKKKPGKVYERVYVHAAKVRIRKGWALMINSIDGYSQFAFEAVLNETPQVTVEVLNQLFDNILKNYKPIFHPKQIVFITSLPEEEYGQLFMKTKAAHHRFVYNREATLNAMKELLGSLRFEMVEL